MHSSTGKQLHQSPNEKTVKGPKENKIRGCEATRAKEGLSEEVIFELEKVLAPQRCGSTFQAPAGQGALQVPGPGPETWRS